jgi:hypothetical protein
MKRFGERRMPITAYLMLLLSFLGQFLSAQEKSKPCPEPTVSNDSKFRPGQVWQYNARAHEKGSTLTILKVESLPKLGVIIHIRVDKVRLRNCTGGPGPDNFQHMPFAREAIERSVTKLEKRKELFLIFRMDTTSGGKLAAASIRLRLPRP